MGKDEIIDLTLTAVLCEGHVLLEVVPGIGKTTLLVPIFPGGENDLTVLTRAYLSVRYGELPETTEEVTTVANAWERLKALKPAGGTHTVTRRRKS